MFVPKLLRLAAFSLIALGGLTAVAAAKSDIAYTKNQANLREGPGTSYAIIASLPVNTEVTVEACTATWCAVTTEDDDEGFVARSMLKPNLSGPVSPFNFQIVINPGGPFLKFMNQPPAEPEPSGTPEVCFYQGPNFSDANFCVHPGDEDEQIPGSFNDAIESILISGGATVEVCADPGYEQCKTYDHSVKKLPLFLRDEISSYSVEGDNYDSGDNGDTPDDGSDGGSFTIN